MRRFTLRTVSGLAAAVLAVSVAAGEDKPKVDTIFNGKDLTGWKTKQHARNTSKWLAGSARLDPNDPKKLVVAKEGNELVNAEGKGVDIYSQYVHGDAIVKVEVMVPKGSNSGVYVHGEYEIQVFDSYGKDENPSKGDMGAIYGAAPPSNPKFKAPGEWSQFEIHWRAPRFDADGKKTENARFVKVVLNGQVIHENVEMTKPTPGGVDGKEKAQGPLMFQGDHGPVAFRNITVQPLKP